MVYEPAEDSFLMKEFVRRYAKGNVLDMGTGSGIQAVEASHCKRTDKVYAIDIDKSALAFAKKHAKDPRDKKITWLHGDLFEPLRNKKFQHFFDVIIFNAPYLPQSKKQLQIDTEGGKKGNEIIERFLKDAANFLKPAGKVLLLFSSLTPDVDKIVEQNLFEAKEIGKRHVFFEDMVVWELKPNTIRRSLQLLGVSDVNYFAKGKRGWIFTGKYKKKKVAIKVKNPKSTAMNTIPHEAAMLKLVNKKNIGPKYIHHSPKLLMYEFVEGKYLKDLIEGSKKRLVQITKKVLDQCFALDELGIDKQEMTRPLKHVVVKGSKVTMLDFERARKTESPHNVTQFTQFIGNHVQRGKKKRWVELGKKYKNNPSKEVVNEMKGVLNE